MSNVETSPAVTRGKGTRPGGRVEAPVRDWTRMYAGGSIVVPVVLTAAGLVALVDMVARWAL